MPLRTHPTYRCASGRRNRNYADGALSTQNAEVGTSKRGSANAERGTEVGDRSLNDDRLCVPRSDFRVPRSFPPTNLVQIFQSHQDVPWFRAISGPEDAGQLQL